MRDERAKELMGAAQTTAHQAQVRFYSKLLAGKSYLPSLRWRLMEAKTEEELQGLEAEGRRLEASAETRRAWEKAAEARRGQLRAQALILPPGLQG